jgi:probable rRNA maturation factor
MRTDPVPPALHRIAVQNPSRSRRVPDATCIERWVRHALGPAGGKGAVRQSEVTVRFVSSSEAVALNERFRGRDYAPDVLSFPYGDDGVDGVDRVVGADGAGGPEGSAGNAGRVRGDIAICPAIVAREAAEQGKPFEAHLAHLVVHGVLHLRGYDHVEDRDAARMERLESRLVIALGLGDPWAAERTAGRTARRTGKPRRRAIIGVRVSPSTE